MLSRENGRRSEAQASLESEPSSVRSVRSVRALRWCWLRVLAVGSRARAVEDRGPEGTRLPSIRAVAPAMPAGKQSRSEPDWRDARKHPRPGPRPPPRNGARACPLLRAASCPGAFGGCNDARINGRGQAQAQARLPSGHGQAGAGSQGSQSSQSSQSSQKSAASEAAIGSNTHRPAWHGMAWHSIGEIRQARRGQQRTATHLQQHDTQTPPPPWHGTGRASRRCTHAHTHTPTTPYTHTTHGHPRTHPRSPLLFCTRGAAWSAVALGGRLCARLGGIAVAASRPLLCSSRSILAVVEGRGRRRQTTRLRSCSRGAD